MVDFQPRAWWQLVPQNALVVCALFHKIGRSDSIDRICLERAIQEVFYISSKQSVSLVSNLILAHLLYVGDEPNALSGSLHLFTPKASERLTSGLDDKELSLVQSLSKTIKASLKLESVL